MQRELEEKERKIAQLERALATRPLTGAAPGVSPAPQPPGSRGRAIVTNPPGEPGLSGELKDELLAAHELLRQHTRERGIKQPRTPQPATPRRAATFSGVVVAAAALAGILIGGAATWVITSRTQEPVAKAAQKGESSTGQAQVSTSGSPVENASLHTGLPDPALTPGNADPSKPAGSQGSVSTEMYREVCRRYGFDPGIPKYGVARLIPDWMHGTNSPENLFATSRPLANLKIQFDRDLKDLVDSFQISKERAEFEIKRNWLELYEKHKKQPGAGGGSPPPTAPAG